MTHRPTINCKTCNPSGRKGMVSEATWIYEEGCESDSGYEDCKPAWKCCCCGTITERQIRTSAKQKRLRATFESLTN